MSSRCKSVIIVLSVHSAREVLWDAMRTRHDWLGIFTTLVQELLPGTSLLMVQQSYSFQLSNYDLIFADKYLNTWITLKSN